MKPAVSGAACSGHAVNVLAPAKINLGLEVVRKRRDGYHEVVTLLQAIRLSDSLRIRLSEKPGIRLTARPGGFDLGPPERNLAVRAAVLLPAPAGHPPGLEIELTKRIPVGAGLGGGSSDAAAVLVGLNALRRHGLSPEDLERLGAALGSDVPFFIRGGTQLGTGRGEQVQALPPWPAQPVLLVYPNVSVSTRDVYQRATFGLTKSGPLSNVLSHGFPTDFWVAQRTEAGSSLRNDLEPAVLMVAPVVGGVIRQLRNLGSGFVRVSGSGSAVFGTAPDRRTALRWERRLEDEGHWCKTVLPSRRGCCLVT